MDYFDNIKNIQYDFTVNSDSASQIYILQDILTRVALWVDGASNINMYESYEIESNETPEIVAYKMYGDMKLHWTILYANLITNLQTDWPLGDIALNEFVVTKYTDPYAIHHYESISTGLRGSNLDQISLMNTFGISDVKSVTNFDYEISKNEKKRIIKVIKPQYINNFVKQFNEALYA